MKIIHGDCLGEMKRMKDKSVDFLLTDPPYGILKDDWDKVPSDEYFDEMLRVSKNQIIFGGNFFNLPRKDGWIVWFKKPFLKNSSQCELIWTNFLKKSKVIEFLYAGNCVGTKKPDYKREKVYFTSQKPIEFINILLEQFVPRGSSVFDPFMGTGSTGVSCAQLGYEFIGIEKKQEHFEIAKRRTEHAQQAGAQDK